MTTLLVAQQFAGAANLEIMTGECKAGAKVGGSLNRIDSLLCIWREFGLRGQQQIRISLVMRTSNAAAQLM